MHRPISTDQAPRAIGPYSQAVEAGGFLFLSGAIPLDPTTGQVVDGGIEAQTRRVLDNLEAVLAAAGVGFEDVVKTTVFLRDLGTFATVNGIYAGRFTGPTLPARSTVQVSGLPRDVLVEIEAVALLRHG
jgi:2-iminobutanoate/2-iminopropanoate deaminase